MKIWHMRVPCWIPRASNTHSDCVIRIAVPGQQWLNEHPSVRRYTYSALSVLLVLMSPLQPRAAPSYCITCGNKMPTRCNRGFYCRSYCCSTCFRHHYAHHQELKSIIQWLLRVVFYAVFFSSSWSGVELRVMRPATWKKHSIKYHTQQPLYNTLELLMMGIVMPETCWASNKICNKNLCCI